MNDSERFRFSTRASHHRFDHGLEVIVLRDDFAPVVSVQGWVRSGSMHEEEYLGGGLSHLIEHLVFKRTKHYEGNEIAKAVQSEGGQLNAYTSFDRTVYYVDTPSTGLDTAMRVVTDLIFRPEFPEDEFEREKDVIRREIAMGQDDPERVLGQALFRLAFAGHPCRHPVIGYLEAFNQLTLDDVKNFHTRHYAPNNVFLVVTGDVTIEQVKQWVNGNLSDLERRMRAPVVLPTEPRQVGARRESMSFDTEISRLDLAWRIPPLTHPDMAVFDVLARVLGTGKSSRLYQEIREKQQLAHSVSASSYTPGHEGLFVLNADADPAKVEQLVDAMRSEIRKVIDAEISAEEIEKAKRGVLAGMYSGLSTTNGLASQLGMAWMLTGGLDLASTYLNAVENVDAAAIRRVASEWLTESAECLVILHPAKDNEATKDEVGESVAARLMPDVHTGKAKSGLEILVGSIDRVPLVALQFAFVAGSQSDPQGKAGLARLAARTLLKGTKKRDGNAIMQAMESRGGFVSANAGNNTMSLGLSVMRDDLPFAMEIAGEILTSPLLPEEGFAVERQAQLQAIKQANDRPVGVAMRQARSMIYEGTSLQYGALGNIDSVSALERVDVENFVQQRLVGSAGVVSVFGDAQVAAVEKGIQNIALASGDVNRAREVSKIVEPASLEGSFQITKDKQEGVVVIAFPCPGVAHPDHLALQLINEATSDMASHLFQRIREEQGLAYYVSTSLFFGIGGGMFAFYLGTEPDKLDLAEEVMREEIARIVTDGLADDELDRAKQSMRGSLIMQSQSHMAMGTKAMIDHLLGMGWNAVESELKETMALGREQVTDVARRWLSGRGVSVRVVGD